MVVDMDWFFFWRYSDAGVQSAGGLWLWLGCARDFDELQTGGYRRSCNQERRTRYDEGEEDSALHDDDGNEMSGSGI